MSALRPADWTWLAIGGIVLGHNTVAAVRGHQQLSERADDYQAAHPLLTDTVIALTALHLANRLPTWGDPLHWLFQSKRLRRNVGGAV